VYYQSERDNKEINHRFSQPSFALVTISETCYKTSYLFAIAVELRLHFIRLESKSVQCFKCPQSKVGQRRLVSNLLGAKFPEIFLMIDLDRSII